MLNQYMLASGDRVELVEAVGDFKAGDTGTVCGPASGSAGKGYIVAMDRTGGRPYFSAARLAKLQDDPLPPVPESVMYNAGQGCRLEVVTLPPNENYEARVRIGVFSNTFMYQGKCTCLEPDEALQLAHDIRRMAMEIKRNQKQGQAQ